jgi:hypothetical protein
MAEPIWYYAIDDQEHGPVTPAQLKEIAHAGELLPTDLVWKQGLDDWKPARFVAGLFPGQGKAGASGINGHGQAQSDTNKAATPRADSAEQASPSSPADAQTTERLAHVEYPPDASEDAPPPTPPQPHFDEVHSPPEAVELVEPPAPPPPQADLPAGVPVASDYRPQQRLRRAGVTVGPVTLRLARLAVAISLLLLLALEGCQSLNASYVGRLEAISTGAEQEFLAQWEARRSDLKEQRNALQEKTTRNSVEATDLGRILDQLETLDAEMAAERVQLQDSQWLTLDIAARQAAAAHQQWTWWLQLTRLPLSLLLATGALTLAFFSEAQERWLGIGLALFLAAAVLARNALAGG